LTDPHVSRAHASISIISDGSLILQDEQSKWGTRVNGVVVSHPALLHHGDIIAIGKCLLKVEYFAQALRDGASRGRGTSEGAYHAPDAARAPLPAQNASYPQSAPPPRPQFERFRPPPRPIREPAPLPARWEQNLTIACLLTLVACTIYFLVFLLN